MQRTKTLGVLCIVYVPARKNSYSEWERNSDTYKHIPYNKWYKGNTANENK